jgi:DNA mismatch repair protein MutL
MAARYPMCALHITLPPRAVDVNVHPNKLEVRFRDESAVYAAASSLIARALSGGSRFDFGNERPRAETALERINPIPEKKPAIPEPAPKTPLARAARLVSLADEFNNSPVVKSPVAGFGTSVTEPVTEHIVDVVDEPMTLPGDGAPAARVIGVYANTYILAEMDSALVIIDQHAAHERILYERYMAGLQHESASQPLLLPVILPMSAREIALIMDNIPLLEEIGYEVEPFGERDIRVRAVPVILGNADLKQIFLEVIDQLESLKGAARERRRAGLIMASCRHAVKAGDALSEAEIMALIAQMRSSGAPPTCPHGRPALKVIRRNEMEGMFKRA